MPSHFTPPHRIKILHQNMANRWVLWICENTVNMWIRSEWRRANGTHSAEWSDPSDWFVCFWGNGQIWTFVGPKIEDNNGAGRSTPWVQPAQNWGEKDDEARIPSTDWRDVGSKNESKGGTVRKDSRRIGPWNWGNKIHLYKFEFLVLTS